MVEVSFTNTIPFPAYPNELPTNLSSQLRKEVLIKKIYLGGPVMVLILLIGSNARNLREYEKLQEQKALINPQIWIWKYE